MEYAGYLNGAPNNDWVKGFSAGFKDAMRTMYPDADSMFREDPQAADLVLTALALEGLANA